MGDLGTIMAVDRYGASAPAGKIYEEYGLTVDDVIKKSEELLRKVG